MQKAGNLVARLKIARKAKMGRSMLRPYKG